MTAKQTYRERARAALARADHAGEAGTNYEKSPECAAESYEGNERSPVDADAAPFFVVRNTEPDSAPEQWPTLLDLLAERRRRGVTLRDGGPEGLQIDDPCGRVTPALEAALRAREAELLGLLRDVAQLTERKETAS